MRKMCPHVVECPFLFIDVTDVALEWAKKNVESNPHLAELIEIRNANAVPFASQSETNGREAAKGKTSEPVDDQAKPEPPILLGVVKESESFDFCMCNPPFFESIQEAGLNPRTSCGGTTEEMVCPGGELAFITHIIEDSVSLRNSFR
jgi:23S rRNA (adenine1618-N6)-methyltransferase